MIVQSCSHSDVKRNGRHRNGLQRFKCKLCGATFTEDRPKPLGDMRLPMNKALLCLRLLLEGNSIRSVERLTGVAQNTIMALVVEAGNRCQRLLETQVRNVAVEDVQADEIWGFVLCKERVKQRHGYGEECGDCYTFTAIERDTKLLLAFHVGKRSNQDADAFIAKLSRATGGRFQLTTDGLSYYRLAVARYLTGRVDFAQLVKIVGTSGETNQAKHRYSPGEIVEVRKRVRQGSPDPGRICTSHVERANLSIRTTVKRMARLTLSHSKKWENHEAAMALFFGHYNWCRVHGTLKTTPAVAAGLTDHIWTVHELLLRAARFC